MANPVPCLVPTKMEILSTRPSQILIWSYPRTACHLLERMLANQPNVQYCWHPFVSARPSQVRMLSDQSVENDIPQTDRAQYEKKVSEGVRKWTTMLSETEARGETLLMHDHACFAFDPDRALELVLGQWNRSDGQFGGINFTLIPDEILLHPVTIPIFTIRNPVLTSPALYRALRDFESASSISSYNIRFMSQIWQRRLYDWYIDHGITPLVVEAEDYMSSPEFVKHLAKRAGLSPNDCVFEWEAATPEEIAKMDPTYVKVQQTLVKSTGLVSGKVRRDVNLKDEIEKWRAEFGVEGATYVEELVNASMVHYEYLVERKLRQPCELQHKNLEKQKE